MRRLAARSAKAGMVLGRPVYDSAGNRLFDPTTVLDEARLKTLAAYAVAEVVVEDARVQDVPVQPLFAPELEAEAIQALRQLLTEAAGQPVLDGRLVAELERPIFGMTRDLFPDVMGEPNASGAQTDEAYRFARPVRVAGLALMLGRKAGMGMLDLAQVGMAAALMDVGALALPPGTLEVTDSVAGRWAPHVREHPALGARILAKSPRVHEMVVRAVAQHHERWDGSGYPAGLSGTQTCLAARVIGVADGYVEAVSRRPGRAPAMPHEAVEFIMAGSGDLFDPHLAGLFARQVPLYPTGVTVQLNTGEIGIVADSNLGFIGRPSLRVIVDGTGLPLRQPFDLDLAADEHRGRAVARLMDYS